MKKYDGTKRDNPYDGSHPEVRSWNQSDRATRQMTKDMGLDPGTDSKVDTEIYDGFVGPQSPTLQEMQCAQFLLENPGDVRDVGKPEMPKYSRRTGSGGGKS